MIRNIALAVLSLGCLFASPALAQDDLLTRARQQFQPIPTTPPELPGNATSPAKVELGKMLYFDPRLSANIRKERAALSTTRAWRVRAITLSFPTSTRSTNCERYGLACRPMRKNCSTSSRGPIWPP